MKQMVTMSLPAFILVTLAVIAVTAIITALITRHKVRSAIRRNEVREVERHMDSLFHKGHLHAIRYSPGNEHVYARGANSKLFEVPVREAARELAPSTFIGIDREDICAALERLKKSKQYQTVDWHDESGKEFKEVKLRPEFLRSRQPVA